ncbi:glycine cleavage system aminomethyltransferase GcvT [Priestia endophytica]|uniref:glycine cleavage system aminomethyltransferase GcvT n=1 Tax=Priestia endophytica TaxID=135735 RepID=UPI000F5276CA|nr:glycine cleavage system aminomethyltransferase GcvT [Priestia endophytica]MED4070529.1 glycine cleavage system aminomethyltransferase GcvT [Priestia endophytica]RPK15710.1 Aminomethyltransferase (glycine cleavage system T protein) [Priestia endophytica]
MMKKTPLYDIHSKLGAKMIDFGGWSMPVQFSSIKEEHIAVRTKCGLFDVSHMGEFKVEGKGSLDYLQKLMTNDVSALSPGKAQYTAMCYEDGGIVDDLLVYQLSLNSYFVVVNASNIEKDFDWMKAHLTPDVTLTNVSEEIALIALQGPSSEEVLSKLTSHDLSKISFFNFQNSVSVNGVEVLISRTGYTGEDGFEIYCQKEHASFLWETILRAGRDEGLLPCGLGARDTLRFEAALPLYGQELSHDINPYEAGIGFAVKLNKSSFIGKEVLVKQKETGVKRKLVGLEMIERGIPRYGYRVFVDGKEVGKVTTGTQSPTLKKNIGLALINEEYTSLASEVFVEIRNKFVKASIIKTPFYKRKKGAKTL